MPRVAYRRNHALQTNQPAQAVTPKSSYARLTLYILIAMGTSASAGLATVNFTDWRETTSFALSVVMTGLVTARSYIDQTPTQIDKA